jgi:hypothetical protein
MYMHFAADSQSGSDTAKQYIDSLVQQLKNIGGNDPEQGDWEGGELTGTYAAIDIGSGSGMIVFAVNDSPIAGVLMNVDIGGTGDINDLLDYFDQHVKPGGDGGGS